MSEDDSVVAVVDEFVGSACDGLPLVAIGTDTFLFNCALINDDGIISFLTPLIEASELTLFGPVFSFVDENIDSDLVDDACKWISKVCI